MSACSILLVSANRHTSPYPVYPLGLSYLKTYLERTINGIRVDIADCNLLSDAQLAERIRTLAPRYIGLSLRNVDGANSLDRRGFLPQYRALADVIRAASDAPLIIGGAGFSIYPEAFMRELGADYGIHGEGEEPLAELIGALERGRTEIDIPSVYTRDGRRGSGRRSYLPSIEVQFEPELTGYYWKRSGMLNIQTKRGCPYDCIYCSYPSIDGRCVRTMDPEAIAENILRAKRDYGISYLFFTDSVFNIGPEYNVRLAETLIRRRTDIRWGAYFSPRGIDAEQMRRLLRPLPDPGRLRRHARKRARNDRKLAADGVHRHVPLCGHAHLPAYAAGGAGRERGCHRPGRRPDGAELLYLPGFRPGRGAARGIGHGQGVGFPRRPAERAGGYAAVETK